MDNKIPEEEKYSRTLPSTVEKNKWAKAVVAICSTRSGQLLLPALLAQLPLHSGFTYVIVQHVATVEEAMPLEILQQNTVLSVEQAADGTQLMPDAVYLLPINAYAGVAEGRLVLSPRSRTEVGYGAAAFFLMKLARKCTTQVVAVLLGEADAFTGGSRCIKSEGGIVMMPDSHHHHNESNRNAEPADISFVPDDFSDKLQQLFSEPYEKLFKQVGEPDINGLKSILNFIYSQRELDFSLYKPAVLYRRISRRMRLNEVTTMAGYFEVLAHQDNELTLLCQELGVNMNGFFRDPSVYQALANHVFPKLLKDKTDSDTIRIWCPCCSTGEEVVSLAICLLEYLKANNRTISLQFFGTDLNKDAVRKAHFGYYSTEVMQNVSPLRLRTYFHKVNDQYQVASSIRDSCIFARQNLLKDPPFPKLDLISFQNELVTLSTDTQHHILQSFHYGLKANGFLILNKSENFTSNPFFTQLSKDLRIYTRNAPTNGAGSIGFQHPALRQEGKSSVIERAFKEQNDITELEKASEKLLLSRYVPASIVINGSFQIIRFHGPIYKYLQPTSGKASLNVLSMIQEDLALELHYMVQQVVKTGRPVRKENITLASTYGEETKASIEITPIRVVSAQPFYLVIFEEKTRVSYAEDEPDMAINNSQRVRLLEQELKEAREQLQTFTEEFKATREELQATSEETTANNEELRSINEELQTNKQELQEAVKSIITANEELAAQNATLSEAIDYSSAILEAIQEPLVLLNTNLSIYTANKAFYNTFKLTPADVEGHFLYDIASNRWNVPELLSKLSEIVAVKKKGMSSFEVPSPESRVLHINAVLLETGNKKNDRIMLTMQDVTQQRHAREAKEWLAAVVSASNEGIISFTTSRTVISWNKGAEEIFGYKEEEMVCKSLSRLVKQSDKLAQHKLIERVVRGETVRQEEIECVHKKGHMIYVSISMALMKDLKGNVKGLMASVQDITERRLAQEALRESEERYRPIVSESAVGIVRADFSGKLLFVNQQFCDMLKYTAEELLEKSIWDLCHSNQYDVTKERLRQMQAEGTPFEYEKQLTRKNDTPLWANINLSAIKNAKGEPFSITAVIVDISKRKEAEAALQKAKESLQLALEAANMGIWEMDISNGESTYHSLRNDQIFGYSTWQPKWTIGMARIHVLDEDKPVFDEAVARLIEKGRLQMEVRVKWPDGNVHWIHKVGRLFYDADGKPQRAAGVAMDITDRKLIEQRKEEFISIASHELKTPVTSIKAYAQILQEQFLEEQDFTSANMLGKLDKQVDKLTDLIKDLLDTTRITEGQMVLRPEIFDINSLIKEVADDIQPSAIHHELVKELLPVSPVEADRERVRQVLVNLISNAIKYSPAAGKVIIRTSGEKDEIQVSVQDFGIGMSAEAQQKIFDRFFRVNSTRAKAFPGLGLGLFISSEIVKQHSGKIWVNSQEEQGSEFYFTLPVKH